MSGNSICKKCWTSYIALSSWVIRGLMLTASGQPCLSHLNGQAERPTCDLRSATAYTASRHRLLDPRITPGAMQLHHGCVAFWPVGEHKMQSLPHYRITNYRVSGLSDQDECSVKRDLNYESYLSSCVLPKPPQFGHDCELAAARVPSARHELVCQEHQNYSDPGPRQAKQCSDGHSLRSTTSTGQSTISLRHYPRSQPGATRLQ